MTSIPSPTPTRSLALAAAMLVAGVLCLRAIALFSAPPASPPAGSIEEQRLTALITPLIGKDRVRVSIDDNKSGQKVWLILIDGPVLQNGSASNQAEQIEAFAEARGFDESRDSLQIVQQPFATSVLNAPSRLEILELTGLGLTALILLTLYLRSSASQETPADFTSDVKRGEIGLTPTPTVLQTEQQPLNDNRTTHTKVLANAAPERSAALIRRWMQGDKI